jgi:hypothetical protein
MCKDDGGYHRDRNHAQRTGPEKLGDRGCDRQYCQIDGDGTGHADRDADRGRDGPAQQHTPNRLHPPPSPGDRIRPAAGRGRDQTGCDSGVKLPR